MSNHKFTIPIPSFAQYAYTILKKLSTEEQGLLTDEERGWFESDIKLKNFCRHHSLDRIYSLLSKLGFNIWIFIGREQDDIDNSIISAYEQYNVPEKKVDNTLAMAKNNVFVIDSKDMMFQMHMLKQNVASKAYTLNEHTILIEKATKWKPNKSNDNINENAANSYVKFAKIAGEAFNSLEFSATTLKLEPIHVQILLQLFAHKDTTINIPELCELVSMSGKRLAIRKRADELFEMKLVARTSNDKNPHYTINAKGIDIVMQILKRIVEKAEL